MQQKIQERIQREIDLVVKHMGTCDYTQREYAIGALTALLWVQDEGRLHRQSYFVRAIELWNQQREVTS